MKKIYSFILALLTVISASAADYNKIKPLSVKRSVSTLAENTAIQLNHIVASYYSEEVYDTMGDYYTILSNTTSAVYDSNAATINATDGWVLVVDFAAARNETMTLPAGSYKMIDDPYPDEPAAGTAISDYSFCCYFDAQGNQTIYATLKDVVKVVAENGIYTVTATAADQSGNTYTFTFNGRLPYTDPSKKTTVYRQIQEDRHDIKFKGGMAFYYGHFQTTMGGTMMIQLYDGPYDEERGAAYDGTTMICLDIIQRYFVNKEDITIDEGTYKIVPLRSVERNTAGAAEEMDYMGQTIVLGTYLRDRDSQKYSPENPLAFANLKSGDIVIEKTAKGYHIKLENGVTDLGYEVTFDYEGPIGPIIDYSDEETGSSKSTITDDVDLKLDDLPKARVYHPGSKNGFDYFLVDIGSRSGKDPERNNGGDIIRMEFVAERGVTTIQPGTYTIMEEKYENYYQPWSLGQTYWISLGENRGTDISGTCYIHFEEGRYYIMDDYAWFLKGVITVSIPEQTGLESEDLNNRIYSFDIDLTADNGFYVSGKWTGPLELMYDPKALSSIEAVNSDGAKASVLTVGEGIYRVCDYAGEVSVFNTAGSLCGRYSTLGDINLTHLPTGIYILNIGGKAVKVTR